MTFFGLKSRQDLENWAAQLHQEFPEVHPLGLYYCGHTKHSRLPPAKFGIQIRTLQNLLQLHWTGKSAEEVFQKSRGMDA